ncbi:SpoIIIAH-like family protein [Anaerosinus gibii]|uniref:SpoIIIAH-like family protein n=1 Tax=Selenobaculum gibii TaxID=3054208 RepID=A0A9Y2AKL1_9FIRM|nr:SpoIIIAH-like family protein [Selenobaculum gbiensis]WIW71692.1 SpoIIIAH-like family protein [Selenobaculum gbiensis]
MIIELKKHKNYIIIVCFFILLGILYIIRNIEYMKNAKADSSNAVQVVSKIEEEPLNNVDFFMEYRLERDKMRSEQSDVLRESIKNGQTEEIRKNAQANILKILQEKERENEMESLIRAKGFSDALVFCRDSSASILVRGSNLSQNEVMQVADIVSRIGNIKKENITISVKE